jgi:hypothetical protein
MWLIKLPAVPTTKIVFTTADQSLTAGSVSDVVTIQTRDEFNNPANVTNATTVKLTTTSAVGKFDTSASGPFDGSITSDSASFYYRDTTAGTPIITATGTGYTSATQQEIVNPAPASQIRVETAANGTGNVVGSKNLATGTSLTVYAISRDQYYNYVANVAGSWSLTSKTGGVADSDLVPRSDGKSAVFTGSHTGTARIHAVNGSLAPGDSGIISVVNYGDANEDGKVNMGDVTKVERIILGLDPPTCSCDANRDGKTNMGDVTRIERVILGLDPLIG